MGENKGKRNIEQAGDFLSSAMLAWVGPRACFLPGTVSTLTIGYGIDLGPTGRLGVGVLMTCALCSDLTP